MSSTNFTTAILARSDFFSVFIVKNRFYTTVKTEKLKTPKNGQNAQKAKTTKNGQRCQKPPKKRQLAVVTILTQNPVTWQKTGDRRCQRKRQRRTLLALATRAKIPTDITKSLTLPPLRKIIQRKKDLATVTVVSIGRTRR
jgi:hypothetical protein